MYSKVTLGPGCSARCKWLLYYDVHKYAELQGIAGYGDNLYSCYSKVTSDCWLIICGLTSLRAQLGPPHSVLIKEASLF